MTEAIPVNLPEFRGTWELVHDDFRGWRLVLHLADKPLAVEFPLPADHGIVLGVRATARMRETDE